ncbi:MAG: hypothetical protein RBR86_08900 [Pseudobdellovibrionaceae bacterium]|jgi:hypothetical protein|nr:hypothetical protein [Pseudobdellovibrionaceae bacterium]
MKNSKFSSISPSKRGTESGNALVIILVTIGLLVGLTVILTRMTSKTSGNLSAEQARIVAENIMRSAQTYEAATQKMINVNRCSENQLNFDNSITSIDYDNTNAPSNGRCDYFNLNGAGLIYTAPDPDFLDASLSSTQQYGEWVLNASQCILEVGTGETSCTDDSEAELIIMIPHIREEVCMQLNKLNNIDPYLDGPPREDQSGTGFTGTFSISDGEIGDLGSSANLIGKATGCFQDLNGSWDQSYVFYHTLLAR